MIERNSLRGESQSYNTGIEHRRKKKRRKEGESKNCQHRLPLRRRQKDDTAGTESREAKKGYTAGQRDGVGGWWLVGKGDKSMRRRESLRVQISIPPVCTDSSGGCLPTDCFVGRRAAGRAGGRLVGRTARLALVRLSD